MYRTRFSRPRSDVGAPSATWPLITACFTPRSSASFRTGTAVGSRISDRGRDVRPVALADRLPLRPWRSRLVGSAIASLPLSRTGPSRQCAKTRPPGKAPCGPCCHYRPSEDPCRVFFAVHGARGPRRPGTSVQGDAVGLEGSLALLHAPARVTVGAAVLARTTGPPTGLVYHSRAGRPFCTWPPPLRPTKLGKNQPLPVLLMAHGLLAGFFSGYFSAPVGALKSRL